MYQNKRIGVFISILGLLVFMTNTKSFGQKVEIEAPHSLSVPDQTPYSTGDGMGVNVKYTVLNGEGTAAAPGTLGPPIAITTGSYTVHENVTNTVTQHAITPAGKQYDSTPKISHIPIDHPGNVDIVHPDGTFTDPIGFNATPLTTGTSFEKAQGVTLDDGTLLTVTITSIPHDYVLFNGSNPPHHFSVGSGACTVTITLLKTSGFWILDTKHGTNPNAYFSTPSPQ